MTKPADPALRLFFLSTYLIFWLLFALTGLSLSLGATEPLVTVLKDLCAWSSTFALLLFFRRLDVGEPLSAFLRRQFPRVRARDFLLPSLLQLLIAALAILLLLALKGESPRTLRFVAPSGLLPLLLLNLVSGPTGEELGWRGYALNRLKTRHAPLVAYLAIGLLWGLWHFPLWLVTGLRGADLLLYSASFMLGILAFSVFLGYFYGKSGNLLVAVWLHLLFNLLMQVAVIEDFRLISLVSLGYLLASLVILLVDRKALLARPGIPPRP